MTEDEMVGWHHRLNGCDFEQASGDSEGHGGLACCSPWGCRVGHDWRKKSQRLFFCLLFCLAALQGRWDFSTLTRD